MNIVIITQKPIQTLSLLYLLGGEEVFPSAIVFVSMSDNHKHLGMMDEVNDSLGALRFQCEVLNIPFYSLEDIHSKDSLNLLKLLKIDLVLSLVTDIILKSNFIDTSKYGVVSSHGGILPKYRGLDCLCWAVLNGEKDVGISTQLIDSGVDTGYIISTSTISLNDMMPTTVSELNKVLFYQKKLYAFIDPVKQLINNGKIETNHQKVADGKQYFLMHQDLRKNDYKVK